MRIALLTSSRADYSIYLPLIKALEDESSINLSLIVFGTHLSPTHGYTIDEILKDGFQVAHRVETVINGDSPADISQLIAVTIEKFSDLWAKEHFDLVFALGDRFEMFAAVTASLPFNIQVAHLHGGETTLGAIDNALRHSISLMSKLHFVSTVEYEQRLINLLGHSDGVHNVGALSYENFRQVELMTIEEFRREFSINLSLPTILCTFHPETVAYEKNKDYIEELVSALTRLDRFQVLITMPNIDTMGGYVRNRLLELILACDHVKGVESLGSVGYLSAMKYSVLVLGNSSSGFVDASFFPKKVINLGDRQSGRIRTPNIYDCPIERTKIYDTIIEVEKENEPKPILVYGDGSTSKKVISIIKNHILNGTN